MNDDDFVRQLRSAEGPVSIDPRFADTLYLELATELDLPSAHRRTRARSERRARARVSLLAAALLLLALAITAAVVGSQLLVRPSMLVPSDVWHGFGGDAARRAEAARGPKASPVLRWRFQASGAIMGSVSVAGDLVYAA